MENFSPQNDHRESWWLLLCASGGRGNCPPNDHKESWLDSLTGIPVGLFTLWLCWWALIDDFSWNWVFIVPIAVISVGIWLIRGIFALSRGYETRRFVMFVPFCLVFYGFLALTNIPKRAHFWAMKPTLEEIRRNPAPFLAEDQYWRSEWPQRGSVTVSKSKKAVRVILWESGSFIGTQFLGYAHCPHGCGSEDFGDKYLKNIPMNTNTLFSFSEEWHMVSYKPTQD